MMTLQNRINLYNAKFSGFQMLYLANDRRIEGLWIMGNNYKTSGLYGAYPHGYLDRVSIMFPDKKNILHLFAGSLPKSPNYLRVDTNPERADVVGDAHELSNLFPKDSFDLIYADPPYSIEDAMHYGTSMIKRQTVLKECLAVLKPGGHVIWLDQVLPNFSKRTVNWMLAIGMIKSTNHRVRAVFGFEKL